MDMQTTEFNWTIKCLDQSDEYDYRSRAFEGIGVFFLIVLIIQE